VPVKKLKISQYLAKIWTNVAAYFLGHAAYTVEKKIIQNKLTRCTCPSMWKTDAKNTDIDSLDWQNSTVQLRLQHMKFKTFDR